MVRNDLPARYSVQHFAEVVATSRENQPVDGEKMTFARQRSICVGILLKNLIICLIYIREQSCEHFFTQFWENPSAFRIYRVMRVKAAVGYSRQSV